MTRRQTFATRPGGSTAGGVEQALDTARRAGVAAQQAQESATSAGEAAAEARARAENVRGMILRRDERFDTVDERVAALVALTGSLESVAQQVEERTQSSLADRSALREALAAEITRSDADRVDHGTYAAQAASLAGALAVQQSQSEALRAALAALTAATGTDRQSATATLTTALAAVDAERARATLAEEAERTRALAAEVALSAASRSARQDAETADAALRLRIVALETRMPAAAYGRASTTTPVSIAGNGTYSLPVVFDAPAPDAAYLPMPVVDSSSLALFGALDVVAVDQRTTAGCRVTVRNTALVAIAGSVMVTVIALRL